MGYFGGTILPYPIFMEIKHTISFKLRTYGLKGGKYQIRLRISFNGFRHDVVTGCVLLDRNAWDEKAELVKDGYVGLRGETAASWRNTGLSR